MAALKTRIVAVPSAERLGHFVAGGGGRLEQWRVNCEAAPAALHEAAQLLRESDTPVAFPTETVYGLGADATRAAAVEGIFKAKGRPSDNPLIVHVADVAMLRDLLRHHDTDDTDDTVDDDDDDVIPACYLPLIENFWPGPLTILLPLAPPPQQQQQPQWQRRFRLAPPVTAGLPTFGVRMPSSPLALTLIKMAGVPLAAPSANASTRPSPTTAQHVRDDLDGRISLILDGGPCSVGVESTVVDGLCDPPVVLRPGGVSMDDIRRCPGWHAVVAAYKDHGDEVAPRAPGMKYKHYSPKASVVLYEASCREADAGLVAAHVLPSPPAPLTKIGLIRTRRWAPGAGLVSGNLVEHGTNLHANQSNHVDAPRGPAIKVFSGHMQDSRGEVIGQVFDIGLGADSKSIAHGLFTALRELDGRGADVILVDGIEDELDMAAAVMNRLRKAASETRR